MTHTAERERRIGTFIAATAVAVAAVGGVLLGSGVVVRWLSFALYRDSWPLIPYAPALPPTDLAFLGFRGLLNPYVIILLVSVVVLLRMTRGQDHRYLVYDRAARATQDSARLRQEFDQLNTEDIRATLDPTTSEGRRARIRGDLDRVVEANEQMRLELRETIAELDALPHPPHVEREYPIKKFGIWFSGRRYFVAFLVGIAGLAYLIVTRPFPSEFVAEAAFYIAFLMAIRGTFGRKRSLPWLIAAVVVVAAGAVFASSWDYRLPVGTFSQTDAGVAVSGRYAVVGRTEQAYFLRSCDQPDTNVSELFSPPEIVQIEFNTTAAATVSLWDVVVHGASVPVLGPTANC